MRPNSKGGSISANGSDTAIARLLYAMLKQRSLKDIDWNEVARDPVLLEEISNGHAARMRFSRFRALVENPNSRPVRSAADSAAPSPAAGSGSSMARSKVVKAKPKPQPKRDTKDGRQTRVTQKCVKRRKEGSDDESSVRMECMDEDQEDQDRKDLASPSTRESGQFPIVKMERMPSLVQAQMQVYPPASGIQLSSSCHLDSCHPTLQRTASCTSDIPPQLRAVRLLTPCSDIDSQQQLEATAAAGREAGTLDFASATAAAAAIAAANYNNGNGSCWIQSQQPCPFPPAIGAFDMAPYAPLDTATFVPNDFGQASPHHYQQSPQSEVCGPPSDMGESSLVADAFFKHGSGWNAMFGDQGSSHNHHASGHGGRGYHSI